MVWSKTYYCILLVVICCSNSVNFIKFVIKEFLWYSNIFLSTFFSIDYFKSALASPCFIGMSETMRQLRREYWCKLSNSADNLSLLFLLISSVDSRTSSLFSRVTTLFSIEDILPWSTSTNFFNSEISLLDFVLISFFGDSGCLAADFSPFLPILLCI